LVNRGGIDYDVVNLSLGYVIPYRWSLWKPTAEAFRDEVHEETIYDEFEKLAKRIAKESNKLDSSGEIPWEGFKE
jgi:hypothetical protein